MSIWATERTEVLLKSWTKLDYPGEAIRELIADQLREVIAEAIDEAEKYGYRRGFETHRELGPNSLEKEKR